MADVDARYGKGARSIYREEAPLRAAPLRARVSAAAAAVLRWPDPTQDASWRQRAVRGVNKTLVRSCCALERLGRHRVALFVGDSQLEHVVDHMCAERSRQVSARGAARQGACMEQTTALVMVVAAGRWARAYPSFHTVPLAIAAVERVGLPPPTAVVTNFASAHLLHVHPVRPFFDAWGTQSRAAIRCYPQSTCADFRGLVGFDAQVANDVSVVRRSLPSAALVLMTPNWICDAKLYAQYRKQLAAPEPARWSKCIAWVEARSRSHSGEAAREICARDTFSAAGSERMAERVRAAARAAGSSQSLPPVRLLDALAITRDGGGCNSTEDARHFPSLVPTQERELRAVLNG